MRRNVATGVVLALLVGTAVAFAETERLKLQPTPIEESFVQPAFSPTCRCDQSKEEIRLRLHRADRVTVQIRDVSRRAVRLLVRDKRMRRGLVRLEWNGRNDVGGEEPNGLYRIDVHLARPDRTFRLPQAISLDTVAPTTRLISATRVVHLGDRVRIVYRVSEPAHAVLYVNGRRRVVTHSQLRVAKLQWRPPRRGRYRLQLAGVDLAGNLGPRSRVFVIRVRASA